MRACVFSPFTKKRNKCQISQWYSPTIASKEIRRDVVPISLLLFIMTAIGPLTTTFQAPSTCTTTTPQIYQVHSTRAPGDDEYSYVQGPLFKLGSNCYPKGYNASPSAYYSPGVCPQGYTAACTQTSTVQGAATATRTTGKDEVDDAVETAFICCPTATGAVKYTCAATPTAGGMGSGSGKLDTAGATPWMGCQMGFSRAHAVIGATVVKDDGSIGSYGVFTESKGLFAAHSIQVRFRASDDINNTPQLFGVPGNQAPSTPSRGSPSTTPVNDAGIQQPRTTVATFYVPVQTSGSSSGSSSSISSNNNQPETRSEGVSTGAAIGIGIGSAIAGILVVSIIGLFFFLRWRRKRRLPPPVPPKEHSLLNTTTNPNTGNGNNNTLRPPYELSEEAASSSRPRSQSRRLRMMSSRRAMRSTRRGGVLPSSSSTQQSNNNPAELEAVVPSNASSNLSFGSDNRSTPESTSTSIGGWTLRQQRDGVTPTLWI